MSVGKIPVEFHFRQPGTAHLEYTVFSALRLQRQNLYPSTNTVFFFRTVSKFNILKTMTLYGGLYAWKQWQIELKFELVNLGVLTPYR